MKNVLEFAEMVNKTNYAEMSYNELVTLNFAFLLAEGDIKPLIEKKRAEEMERHTDEFVTLMDNYGASKAEILALIEKKAMREKPYGPTPSQDVDDQTPTMDVDDIQDKGESVLALPESFQTTTTGDEEVTPVETTPSEDQNNDGNPAIGMEGGTSDDENMDIQEDSESTDISTALEITPTPILVEAVIEIAKEGRIPDDIDVKAPYFIDYCICHDGKGKLWRDSKTGRNLDAKDLEAFRVAAEKHQRLFRKKEVMMSTDDCLVFREDETSIHVYSYHFPENETTGDKTQKPKFDSYSNHIPYYATVDLHKTHRHMKRAIEKAKEYSASFGSSSSPYYDRYSFHDNNVSTELQKNERVIEDEETLAEIKSSFETFARFHTDEAVIISEDECVAVKVGSVVYVVLFNFPNRVKVSVPAKKKRRKAVEKSESLIIGVEASDSADVIKVPETEGVEVENAITTDTNGQTLVEKAVEFVLKRKETLKEPEETDNNTPYYEQYSVTIFNDGMPTTTAPIKKRMDIKDLESFKVASERFFKLYYKDKDMISTADYLACTWKENRIMVRLYHTPSNPNSVCETVADSQISDVDKDTMKKLRAKMRYAMRKAKKDSLKNEEEPDKAFYDRYEFFLEEDRMLCGGASYSRRYDEASSVIELKSAFEDYVKLFFDDPMVISTKDFVAVMETVQNSCYSKKIDIVYFNVPARQNNGVIQDEQNHIADDVTVTEESSLVINDTPSSVESPLIKKAIEMTMSLPLGNGTDANAPYFVQCDLSVIGEGDLLQKGKPFIKNVSGEEELAKLRRNHLRFAKTMKARQIDEANNYTAFFWNEGKNLTVFYYNTECARLATS